MNMKFHMATLHISTFDLHQGQLLFYLNYSIEYVDVIFHPKEINSAQELMILKTSWKNPNFEVFNAFCGLQSISNQAVTVIYCRKFPYIARIVTE